MIILYFCIINNIPVHTMMRFVRNISTVLLLTLTLLPVNAQRVALRNNLLYDATLTPNIGMDIRLNESWTFGAVAGLNAWDIDKEKNKKWRHFLIAPNVRRWLGDSLFHKSYVEADLIYSHYNVGNTKIPFGLYKGVQDRRLQGDLLALGGKYGYSWILARHWRIEAEAGVAVGYAWFKEYECPTCGAYLGEGNRIFLLPQLGINVVYIIN